MEKRKAIALNGITFYHTQGHSVVAEGCSITFFSFEQMEKYIDNRRLFWSELLNLELSIWPDHSETLVEKDILKVLNHVCDKLGTDFESAQSRYQGGEEVRARRMTVTICYSREVQQITIAKVLKQDHSTIVHAIKTNKNLCETNATYRAIYLETEKYVMEKIGGRFLEDGGGNPELIKTIKHE